MNATTIVVSIPFQYGLLCLASHMILYVIFRYVVPINGPWKEMPHFTAHQAVAFVLMIQWTYWGFFVGHDVDVDDDVDDASDSSNNQNHKHDDLPLVLLPNRLGLQMTKRCMEALWIWDVPVSMFTNDMKSKTNVIMDPIMHAHHFGMLLVACIALGYLTIGKGGGGTDDSLLPKPVGSCFAHIFFGQIELSSIPLQIVDLFHPNKSPAWYSYLQQSSSSSSSSSTTKKVLQTVNDSCRILFAILFLFTRGIFFPYIVITKVIPEFWYTLQYVTMIYQPPQTQYILPIVSIIIFAIAFTILQLYWSILIMRQIYKTYTSKVKQSRKKNID